MFSLPLACVADGEWIFGIRQKRNVEADFCNLHDDRTHRRERYETSRRLTEDLFQSSLHGALLPLRRALRLRDLQP